MGSFAHLSCMDCIRNTIAAGLFEQRRIQQKISCIFIACQIQTEHAVRKKLTDDFYCLKIFFFIYMRIFSLMHQAAQKTGINIRKVLFGPFQPVTHRKHHLPLRQPAFCMLLRRKPDLCIKHLLNA